MYISGPRAGDVGVPDALLVWEAVPWHQLGLDTGWCTPAYCTGASGALSYNNAQVISVVFGQLVSFIDALHGAACGTWPYARSLNI